ncbi:polysaccharide biosynthesis/export family protein [Actibacterium sp. 188UL27-1]|uniref:polysaccharide biosynthesis/export family protein n=1 Tax=Actibacterium sp. 188UL27-1 TaxID=2786961 RepID=UPI00195BE67A|nr:polysaccharide biosynthesis/export family protein [Actibacterium sp. 188UL27-1]MBM7069105.1 polysaccharide biosynthesis/export family protein [Actibacterium sp. 188UL27-1]
MRSVLFSVVFLALSVCTGMAQTAPAPYTLGAGDRLDIRVVVWAEVARQYELWTAVSGSYAVQSDGYVLVPIAGPIDATGKTPAELSEDISAALEIRANLIETPATSVEISEHRPFYIIGDVNRPGVYPTTPGLTIGQAFAVAGGGSAEAASAEQGTMLREASALQQANVDIFRETVRAARLQAEVSGADDIAIPSDIGHPSGDGPTAQVVEEEAEVFRSRRAALNLEAETLDELKGILNNEIAGLEGTLDRLATQLELARTRFANIESLVESGRARATQLVDVQRDLFNLENKEIDLRNAMFRAQQRVKEAERDLVALRTKSSTQSAVELQKVNAELERLNNQRAFLREAIAEGGGTLSSADAAEIETTFFVTRADDPEGDEQTAATTDRLSPGDILRVSQVLVLDPDGS